MDPKRLILALVLSMGVIVFYPKVYSHFFPTQEITAPVQTPASVSVEGGKAPLAVSAAPAAAARRPAAVAAEREERITVETPLYTAVITNQGGGVRSWKLKKYRTALEKDSDPTDIAVPLEGFTSFGSRLEADGVPDAMLFEPSAKALTIGPGEERSLTLRWSSPGGVGMEKTYVFNGSDYMMETGLKVTNGSSGAVKGAVKTYVTGVIEKESKGRQAYHSGPVRMIGDKIERQKAKEPQEAGAGVVRWLGTEDKYFLTAIIPDEEAEIQWESAVYPGDPVDTALVSMGLAVELGPGEKAEFGYRAYMGPKELGLLKKQGAYLDVSVEFGMFAFLARPFLAMLNFLQKYVRNYGLAIIILTVFIKIVFYPLTKSSLTSMKKLKDIQPQMSALKERYKDDKVRMNKELMALYKRYKVNPVGGCMPMLLQIPVFIGLYEVLGVAIELRHAPFFLWLVDLSAKDPYYVAPVLMGGSMFIQQKMTPTAMDPVQEKIMLGMPIFMTFLFLSFPSGLVLYWFVNNVLSIAQQYHIHRGGPKSRKVELPARSGEAPQAETPADNAQKSGNQKPGRSSGRKKKK